MSRHHTCEGRATTLMSTRSRQSALRLAALLVLSLSGCSFSRSPDFPLTTLSAGPAGLDPLRKAFNDDVGKVRLMLLLDPT